MTPSVFLFSDFDPQFSSYELEAKLSKWKCFPL